MLNASDRLILLAIMAASRSRESSDPTDAQGVRFDKWLWAARFYKTRSLAQAAIEAGQARIGGQRVKPAREVRVGDRVELTLPGRRIEIDVLGLSSQRGPAPVAQTLYQETADSLARNAAEAEARRLLALDRPGGPRPTKRDRRQIERFQP